MPKIYAGIGSRRTPDHILEMMNFIADNLADDGWLLRSGGAPGADSAFQSGVESWCNGKNHEGPVVKLRDYQEIFIPWNGFCGLKVNEEKGILLENNPDAYAMAKLYHPVYDTLDKSIKSLMARNCMQILGKHLNTPVKFVICWTPDASLGKTSKETGGTGQAIRLAFANDIPIFNLADEEHFERLESWLNRWP